MKFNLKSFLKINLGVIILATGLYFFLMPSNLAVGGVAGLAMVINKLYPIVHVGTFMLVINIFLFVLAFLVIGKEFGGYTIYTSLALSGTIYILERIYPMSEPIVDDLFLNLIFGILISAGGMAIIFNENTSTGGTDIVAKIINKFFHLEIGKSLFLADFLIVLAAGLTFGPELGMYALLGILISSTVIDKIIAGFGTKVNVSIISDEEDEIRRFVTEDLSRGVTILYGAGGFSNKNKTILNTIVPRKEYLLLRGHIKEIDPNAFVWVSFVTEVLGEGFDQ